MLTVVHVITSQRFEPGRCVMTRGVAAMAEKDPAIHLAIAELIKRHLSADFGEVGEEDRNVQLAALEAEKADPENAERMISAYTLGGERVWIITEWDRSATTVLLPEEY